MRGSHGIGANLIGGGCIHDIPALALIVLSLHLDNRVRMATVVESLIVVGAKIELLRNLTIHMLAHLSRVLAPLVHSRPLVFNRRLILQWLNLLHLLLYLLLYRWLNR